MKIIMIICFFISTLSYAEASPNWFLIGEQTSDSASVEIDMNSIKREGRGVLIWTRQVEPVPFMGVKSRLSLERFDCRDSVQTSLRVVTYSPSGARLEDFTPRQEFKQIIPGSYGETIKEKICR